MHFARFLSSAACGCLLLMSAGGVPADDPTLTVDLAGLTTDSGDLLRVYGSNNDGRQGVPVAGGFDCDGDGLVDYAMAAFQAHLCDDLDSGCLSPALERTQVGEVYLRFGTGAIQGSIDSAGFPATPPAPLLKIAGDQDSELAGSEIWMDDVTGDGIGDLLIARQNFTPGVGRIGAGALTILVGGPELRTYANTLQYLDLRAPPASLTLTTVVGALQQDRLGIWMRTADISGDGTADIVVGADQVNVGEPGAATENHRGAIYVIRGGSHLVANQTVDLANFRVGQGTILAGHLARVTPPVGSSHFHFGATVQVADLDGNGRAEVLAAAALNRSGAGINPSGLGGAHGSGGSANGTVYILWDDNFPAGLWATGYGFDFSNSPGGRSIIDGGVLNRSFGEEMLGGLDYDGDGEADLFIGDIVGAEPSRLNAGRGHVLYDAASLAGLSFDLDFPPMGLEITTFVGGAAQDIATDTALPGDFDGDGFDDLAFSSPHASPFGRDDAGTIHVFHGQDGAWPESIDLLPGALPPGSEVRISEIYGALGGGIGDRGDTLCYSAAAGDVDGDGRVDLITNEMVGNGLQPGTIDVGNLIVVSGALLPEPDASALAAVAFGVLLFLRRVLPQSINAPT